MIRSMTGYGRSKYQNEGREYIVEIKSVNYKYCDVNTRMPYCLNYLEDNLKKLVSENVNRGKIDVIVTFNNNSKLGKNIKINKELAEQYINELKKLEENSIINDISIMSIAKLPDVLNISNDDNEEIIWNELKIALKDAISNFIEMREFEGKKIAEDLINRINKIAKKIEDISTYSSRLIEEYVVKLNTRLKEILKTEVDETRLAQEVVIYADKCSIEEELTRLKSHINQLNNLLNSTEYACIGKKMDFIIQEMNRETNTIGSKSGCLEITNLVIEIKTELEDVREQIQNIE